MYVTIRSLWPAFVSRWEILFFFFSPPTFVRKKPSSKFTSSLLLEWTGNVRNCRWATCSVTTDVWRRWHTRTNVRLTLIDDGSRRIAPRRRTGAWCGGRWYWASAGNGVPWPTPFALRRWHGHAPASRPKDSDAYLGGTLYYREKTFSLFFL